MLLPIYASFSLQKAFSNLTKADLNPALMVSLCGFAVLRFGLGFHYTEKSKRDEGRVDCSMSMTGGTEGTRTSKSGKLHTVGGCD